IAPPTGPVWPLPLTTARVAGPIAVSANVTGVVPAVAAVTTTAPAVAPSVTVVEALPEASVCDDVGASVALPGVTVHVMVALGNAAPPAPVARTTNGWASATLTWPLCPPPDTTTRPFAPPGPLESPHATAARATKTHANRIRRAIGTSALGGGLMCVATDASVRAPGNPLPWESLHSRPGALVAVTCASFRRLESRGMP